MYSLMLMLWASASLRRVESMTYGTLAAFDSTDFDAVSDPQCRSGAGPLLSAGLLSPGKGSSI